MATTSNQLAAGMTISVGTKLYRVESAVKVTVPKGTPFIKAKLRDLHSQALVEKSFKLNQTIEEVAVADRKIEFLYPEGDGFLFLDIVTLDQVLVPSKIIGSKVDFLKEGVDLKGAFYGDAIFAVEFPPFLELMVAKIKSEDGSKGTKVAILETGAKIEVPPFIEVGDIIKVDPNVEEYIQRV